MRSINTLPNKKRKRKAKPSLQRLAGSREKQKTKKRNDKAQPRHCRLPEKPRANYAVNRYELIASVSRESFFTFVQRFWHTIIPEEPVWNWHIEYLCDQLQEVYERVFRGEKRKHDLIINIPPGTTKSTICSVLAVPWSWTRMPRMRHLVSTFSFDLGLDLSRKSRDVVQSELYQRCFPEIKLRADQNTKGLFINNFGGERLAATVGGKNPMGRHAHMQTTDDPIDPAKVLSEPELKAAHNYLTHTLPSRKVNKEVTPHVMVMQRLHQNDPTGFRLNLTGAGEVKHICLPAEITDAVYPKALRRFYRNGLLDPVRLSREVLNELQATSEYVYAGQYLQNPIPLGGGMFKTDRLVERIGTPPPLSEFSQLVRFWDKAATHEDGCYTVGVLMGLHRSGKFWVLDVQRFRFDSHQRELRIQSVAKLDTRRVRIGMEEEGGSSGKDSVQMSINGLAGYRVKGYRPTGDKSLRADPFSSQVNAGNVYLAEGVWNFAYIEELKYFPLSTYKDQVDASSGAFGMIVQKRLRVGAM